MEKKLNLQKNVFDVFLFKQNVQEYFILKISLNEVTKHEKSKTSQEGGEEGEE